MRAKGSITQLVRKARPGYILGEDGCLVAFDESALEGLSASRGIARTQERTTYPNQERVRHETNNE